MATDFSAVVCGPASNETFGLGPHSPSQDKLQAALAATSYASWINICGSTTDEQCPQAFIEGAGLTYARVPVEAPHGLTREVAKNLVKQIDVLPKPVMIQCATANRASAALALYIGTKRGWSAHQTFQWAAAHCPRFLGTPVLRNWVSSSLSGLNGTTADSSFVFRQLFEPLSSTYTYLLGDAVTGEAILVDPVVDKAERDATLARELGLRLVTAVNTHVHADHVSGTAKLKSWVPGLKSGIAAASGAAADICLMEGDLIHFGARHIRVLSTPGHTDGCISFVMDDESCVFTGDALLIRGCGRTDFQQGSSEKLYSSVTGKLFSLRPTTVVYPGHDYNGNTRSTIGEEMALNSRLGFGRSLEEFKTIMAGLNLPAPKQLDVAVPSNMWDGNEIMEAGRPAPDVKVPAPCERCRQDGGEVGTAAK